MSDMGISELQDIENFYGSHRKCRMVCESCDEEHYAPIFDRWVCDCILSVIRQEVWGEEVSKRVNNKEKRKQ